MIQGWQDWVALYFLIGSVFAAAQAAVVMFQLQELKRRHEVADALIAALMILAGWPISVGLLGDQWVRKMLTPKKKAMTLGGAMKMEPICGVCGEGAWKHKETLTKFLAPDYQCSLALEQTHLHTLRT
jgi:hypothetical protein